MKKVTLSFPFPPSFIRDPSNEDLAKAFEHRNSYGGGLGDITIWHVNFPDEAKKLSASLTFLPKNSREIGIFYMESPGSEWGYSGGIKDEETVVAHDGGGCDIRVRRKFLHAKKVALAFGEEMIAAGKLPIGEDWEELDPERDEMY